MALAHLLRRVRRARSAPRDAACPRCRLPLVPAPEATEVTCPFCGESTPRAALVRAESPREPHVHFHRGPHGPAAPCFDPRCRSPRLSPADAAEWATHRAP